MNARDVLTAWMVALMVGLLSLGLLSGLERNPVTKSAPEIGQILLPQMAGTWHDRDRLTGSLPARPATLWREPDAEDQVRGDDPLVTVFNPERGAMGP
jgi:hypothetical protein